MIHLLQIFNYHFSQKLAPASTVSLLYSLTNHSQILFRIYCIKVHPEKRLKTTSKVAKIVVLLLLILFSTFSYQEASEDSNSDDPSIDPIDLSEGSDEVHEIGIREDQLEMIQNLMLSDRFQDLRERIQTEPELVTELLDFIHNDFPELHLLFAQSPHFLLSLIAGNVPNFEDLVSDDNDLNLNELHNLTLKDRENIQSVLLKADGDGIHRGKVH